ncbi:MAG: hypothetical protein A3A33_03695 [Candidatus Yanofskybacteria bacterium RIFCSPLOWO2_01_FULL_49_25]|uniref:PsbP C-terminal domain-containing protein n=1 Tax=Candidatus Yanofskybacteria bacterium RIFCSPLOWO2_01_FULL_49_25 TaxID=1802701 RepID=A0A1F8GV59_9BACT|nr:MAG: hypothetical protein A3A33_03695 [Candidatus Yanofskybacteria bacterium RIFCSPLOWO2_01_FULL_49_25]
MNKTLVGIVIVAVVVVGVYFLLRKPVQVAQTPTSSPSASPTGSVATAGWKVYANTDYSYSFSYPADWQLGDSPNSSVPDTTNKHIAFDGKGYRFQVDVVTPSSACDTAKSCIENNKVSFSSDQKSTGLVSAQAPFLFSEVIERPVAGQSGWRYEVYYGYKNGKVYQIVATYESVKIVEAGYIPPTYASSISKVLATFKFTN